MLFWDNSLFKFDNRNPSSAELYMFVVEATHAWDALQVLADELPQDTGACPVEDTHLLRPYLDRIVDKVGDSLDRFVSAHAPDIDFLFEVESFLVHLLGSILAY